MSTPSLTTRLADRYVLGDVVGTGGGSTVYRGLDELLDRPVAVKTIPAAAVETADPVGRQRFLNEARSMARFHHPHVVRVFDAGEQDGALYLVMEFVDGSTLARVIADQAPIAADRAVAILDQVLRALAAVHADGFVHRDVKPANVLVDRDDHVYLTDFGIAKQLVELEQSLTAIGTVVGTPAYLSPEQAAGAPLSAATDLYAAGMLLAELIGLRRADGSIAACVHPDDPLASVIERATRNDPAERYQSAIEMATALSTAGPTETQVMPAGSARTGSSVLTGLPGLTGPVTATQAIATIAPHADEATSIMRPAPLIDPVLASSAHNPPARFGALAQRTHARWALLALVLFMLIGVIISRGEPLDLPSAPSTVSVPESVSVPASTVPDPASTAPIVVPEGTVAPPPPEPAPSDAGGGGGSGGGQGPQQGNGRGKPPKADKP